MMNYMSEVAKMLGVDIGEEFKCDNGFTYMFTEEGVVSPSLVYHGFYAKPDLEAENYTRVLMSLLNGKLTIVPKPWKPKEDDWYWTVKPDGDMALIRYNNDYSDFALYKLGNCYRTKKEAEANRNKWISFYASDEVLEV